MKDFKFKTSPSSSSTTTSIQEGVHSASIVQVANIGLKLAFNKEDAPVEQMAVVFELETGDLIAKRMKFSDHPSSGCYAVFTAALPDQSEDEDEGG
ncbi:MAG: hypothetical protein DRR42_17005 [Gammaproteobacteria bacterium]|nr:MAG: hypothetical protein DRR42_17005 [Gammaproteobacteria bacterium]